MRRMIWLGSRAGLVDLDVLVAHLDTIVVAAFDFVVDVQFCSGSR